MIGLPLDEFIRISKKVYTVLDHPQKVDCFTWLFILSPHIKYLDLFLSVVLLFPPLLQVVRSNIVTGGLCIIVSCGDLIHASRHC